MTSHFSSTQKSSSKQGSRVLYVTIYELILCGSCYHRFKEDVHARLVQVILVQIHIAPQTPLNESVGRHLCRATCP